jgi:DNA-binding winged helix-turn-helix (wHTH) protein
MEKPWKKFEIPAEGRSDILRSTMGAPSARTISFGPFTLDSDRGVLLRGGEELKLRPKSFDLLCYLAGNPGRLVGKAELIQALWPDAVVGDDALPHCVMEVRKALAEDGHRLIKTVPARGYLFEPDVPRPARRIPYLAGVAALLIAGAGSVAVWRFVRSQRALAETAVIEELAAKGRYFEAWDRASQLPASPRLTALMPVISDDLSVTTSPPGAQVHLTRFGGGSVRTLVGTTPLQHLKIARGEYVISLEKPGFAPFERTISSALSRAEQIPGFSERTSRSNGRSQTRRTG